MKSSPVGIRLVKHLSNDPPITILAQTRRVVCFAAFGHTLDQILDHIQTLRSAKTPDQITLHRNGSGQITKVEWTTFDPMDE